MNNNDNFCQKSTYNGYSSYWRQFDAKPKPKLTSNEPSYTGPVHTTPSFGSSYTKIEKHSIKSEYHFPSICRESKSGLQIW